MTVTDTEVKKERVPREALGESVPLPLRLAEWEAEPDSDLVALCVEVTLLEVLSAREKEARAVLVLVTNCEVETDGLELREYPPELLAEMLNTSVRVDV